MKYARLSGDKKNVDDMTRDEIPYGTEFTCINPECKCRYAYRDNGDKQDTFSKFPDDEHLNGCNVKYFDSVNSVPNYRRFSKKNRVLEKSNWNSATIDSISQMYYYYFEYEHYEQLSNTNDRTKDDFIIDENNNITTAKGEIYLLKFKVNNYIRDKKRFIGYCGSHKVILNFKSIDKMYEFIGEIMEKNNGRFENVYVYYLGGIMMSKYKDNTYYIFPTDTNVEVLIEN